MKKRGGYIVRGLLVVMILLSLFLSFKLGIDSGNQQKTHHPQSLLTNNRSAEELLLPTSFYEHVQNKVYEETKESQLSRIMDEVQKLTFSATSYLDHLSFEKIKEAQHFAEGLEFVYATPITLRDFQEVYGLKGKLSVPDMTFNRIFINFETREMIFINADKKESWTLRTQDSMAPLKERLEDKGMEVTLISDTTLAYVPIKEQKIPKYSYILEDQSYNVFIQALFTDPNSVETTGDAMHTIFKGNQNEEMRINNKNGVLSVWVPIETSDKASDLLKTIEVVSRLGQDFGDLRYFSEKDGHYIYASFVEGYPILAKDYCGKVDVSLLRRQLRLLTNQSVVQIPIPDSRTVTLPSGKEVLKTLKKHHINLSRVQRLQIGYEWEKAKTDTQAVTLIPTWFVYYDKQWTPLHDIIKK